MKWLKQHKIHLVCTFILLIGLYLRLYNLNWGAPFYFHPDERNIASSVTKLNYPTQMNPQFFAYGSLPIYTIYFTGVLWNQIQSLSSAVSFEQAIIISRIYSAVLSAAVTILLAFIAYKTKGGFESIAVALISSFSVGLIQYAHFGTFEMWLTFFSLLQFYFLIIYIDKKKGRFFLAASFVTGILIAIKISSLVLMSIPLLTLIITYKRILNQKKSQIAKEIIPLLKNIALLFLVIIFIFVITNPYAFYDFSSFKGSIKYESDVARGILPVFYTGAFFNSVPAFHQFLFIYPFLINPLFTILLIPSIIVLLNIRKSIYTLLVITFLVHFLSQAYLFTKWTRYIIPTLPFIYLIFIFSISEFIKNGKQKIAFMGIFTVLSAIYTISFIKTNYLDMDSRIQAVNFAKHQISSNSLILSEVYDLGIVPFNAHYSNIVLHNFYDLDNGQVINTQQKFKELISGYDYIILPSPRIMRNRILNKDTFPNGNMFYTQLFEEKLGFKKIYETPCDLLCKIVYIGNPIFNVEETTSVFDRPTIFIFKNTR